ncbi:PadR family transcriptional regulator [Micromonospora sp. NPDC018662]|uniref:PadR family transcriptional regulator n=1 Tax=Micromonospora sp. NPDC018662 TaxID=3364238 RepID=UPI0037B1BF60
MRLTIPVVKVLSALLAAPDEPRYGLDLMRLTGLPSGTLYPVLHRLRAVGWLTAEWEDVDPVAAGRPARRYYRLTIDGIGAARLALAELRALAPGERPHVGGVGPAGAPAW